MTEAPNWDKINEKKRKEIMLGQAMNQSLDFLTRKNIAFTEEHYKQNVKAFFKWNQELYDEVMK